MTNWRIYTGDNRTVMTVVMPPQSVQCVVTSPPYWSQRDYGHPGQIGLEDTIEEYVATMVDVARGVRRVLRDDGTFWLNLGDSYTSGGRATYGTLDEDSKQASHPAIKQAKRPPQPWGLKPKDLIGLPWRVAFALQADGWYLRSDIIWHKPNGMPGSQLDRPTCNHEHIFMLTKQPKYFYDDVAIRTPSVRPLESSKMSPKKLQLSEVSKGTNVQYTNGTGASTLDTTSDFSSKRTVWSVPVAAEREAHFASYPPRLIEPCILAGTSAHGACPKCKAPYTRVVERERVPTRPGTDTKVTGDAMTDGNRDPQRHVTSVRTLGWAAGCACNAGPPVPCVVLDPFGGSCTTVAVAVRLGRRAIAIELNPEYVEIGKRKIAKAEANKGFML